MKDYFEKAREFAARATAPHRSEEATTTIRLGQKQILEAHARIAEFRNKGLPIPAETRAVIDQAFQQFLQERQEALLSLSLVRVQRWLRFWGMRWPSGKAFWRRVHTMRTWPLVGLSEEEQAKSREWLKREALQHGAKGQ